MDLKRIRMDAKLELNEELQELIGFRRGYPAARRWGRDWIDQAEVGPGTDPKRLAADAAKAWQAAHSSTAR